MHRILGLIVAIVVSHSAGCAAYRFGHQSLYRPDIRTVHVPVFGSESLRKNLGERVTEAVIKEIEERTPYKVVTSPNADSILTGRITRESKRVVANNRYDDARDIETELMVQVSWVNRRGELLMQTGGIPLPQLEIEVLANSQFLPEAGQSLATSQQAAIERLAREIVNQMEIWW
ncbi:MAG: hypothetical protein KJ000_09185 [Pirellulaceae bacterium]|nr:hypothetical protein [Pirellulaceae bacterium]